MCKNNLTLTATIKPVDSENISVRHLISLSNWYRGVWYGDNGVFPIGRCKVSPAEKKDIKALQLIH